VKTKIVEMVGKDQHMSKQARRKAATWAPSPMEAAAFAAGGGLFGEAFTDDALAYQHMMESMAAFSMDSSIFAASLQEGFLADAAAAVGGSTASGPCSALSAEAPAFVPAAGVSEGKVEKVGRRKTSALGEKCIGSDTSTEVGESEAEDEKSSPKLSASAAVL